MNRSVANDGETVVAVLHDHLTAVGRFFREQGHVRLQPHHASRDPLYFPEDQVRIRGVVVGLVRNYR